MSFESTSKGIIKQAGILAGAGIIVRIIGLLYKSPLTSIIGDEGNGYYNSAYNWYIIILMISSYSIPSAVSRVLAQKFVLGEYRNAQKLFRAAMVYVLIVGAIGSLILTLAARPMVGEGGAYVLRVFAPTVFLYGPLGVLRGYFQAHKTMVPTSVSQIAEQIINAVVSIMAAYFMTGYAVRISANKAVYGAAGSALGTGAGVLLALIFMSLVYLYNRKYIRRNLGKDAHPTDSYGDSLVMIITVVTPFLLSAFLYNITPNINQKLFYHVMQKTRGLTESATASLYGVYSGKALTITNIPIAMASAMAAAMIPGISEKFIQGRLEEANTIATKVIRISMMIAIPAAVGLCALARPITMILFPQRASLDQASLLLAVLAVTVIFYSQSTITNSVLQGTGRASVPVKNALIALVLQTVLLLLLLYVSPLDNMVLVVTRVFYAFIMFLLNDIACRKRLGLKINAIQVYIMPFIASVIMGGASFGLYYLITLPFGGYRGTGYLVNLLATAVAIMAGAVVYGAFLIKTRVLTGDDLRSLPGGRKLAGLIKI